MKKILTALCFLVSFGFSAVIWDGADETTGGAGRVATGADDGTDSYGYWYSYTDADNKGTSSITFPADVVKDEYDNFYGPLAKATGGIEATYSLTSAYKYPFVGFAFNIASEKTSVKADISCWTGIAVTSDNSVPMKVEIGVVDEATVTEYNNYTTVVPANAGRVELPWTKFEQASGWGKAISQSTALASANAIKFKFGGAETDANTSGSVKITKLETLSDCSPTVSGGSSNTPTENNTPTGGTTGNTDVNYDYNNSTAIVLDPDVTGFKFVDNHLMLDKVQKIEVFDINGQLVKSSVSKTLDLNKLVPGIYFVKAKAVHKIQVK